MHRILFLALFVLALTVPSVLAQDPVKVDPKHYTVEFQNAKVRVLRIKSAMSMPLVARDRVLGVLSLARLEASPQI